MAMIPRVNPQITQIAPLPGVRNTTQVSSAPVEGVADAFRGLGGIASKYAEKVQGEQDTVAIMSAARKYQEWENATMDDPDNPDGMGKFKGRDSLGATTGLVPKADEVIGQISNTLTPQQQQRWAEISNNYRTQFHDRVNRESIRRHDAFTTNERKQSISTASNTAVSAIASGDPETAKAKIEEAVNIFKADQQLEWGEVNNDAVADYESTLYRNGIAGALSRDDFATAESVFDARRESMTFDDRMAVEQVLVPYRKTKTNATEFAAILAGGGGASKFDRIPLDETRGYVTNIIGKAGVVTGTPAEMAKKLLPFLLHQESGNRQDAVSPKGALGAAQLMPETARDQERRLGMPAFLTDTDKDANIRAGEDYLRQQIERFGDPAIALAAYNAGPERVAGWVKKGIFYTAKTGEAPKTLTDTIATIRDKHPGDTKTQDAQIQLAKVHFAEQDQAERDAYTDLNERFQTAPNTGTMESAVGPSGIARLQRDGKLDEYRKAWDQRRLENTTKDDVVFVYGITELLRDGDTKNFLNIDVNNPKTARRLSQDTRGKIQTMQAAIRKGGEAKASLMADHRSESDRLSAGFSMLGIAAVRGNPSKNEDQRAAFSNQYQLALRELISNKGGKKPTPPELDALVNSVATRFNIDQAKSVESATLYNEAGLQNVTLKSGVTYSGQDIADARARLRRSGRPDSEQDALNTLSRME